jgi:O-antigen/teichoic acid export membrane protein
MGKGRAISNLFSLSLMQVGNYLLPVVTLPIIARIIGVENYGLINYAFAFTGYFMLVINAGFDMYGCRKIAEYADDKTAINKVVSRIFSAKAVLSVIASFCFVVGLFLVPQLRDHKLLAVVTFLLCFGWVCNPSWLYHAMKDSAKFAMFSFISKLAFSILVVILIKSREDYILHPLVFSVSHIIFSVFSFRYAMRKYQLTWTWSTWSEVKRTIHDNRRLSLISIITQQALPTNIVISGIVLSGMAMGYFSAAIRVVMILQAIFIMPLATVLFPYIAGAFRKSGKEGMWTLGKIFPYLLTFSFAAAAGIYIFSGSIVSVLFGQEFRATVPLLKIFSIGLFFSILNQVYCQQAMVNMNRESIYVRLLLGGTVINMILLPLLIQQFGWTAASWCWTMSEIIVFSISIFYIRPKKEVLFRSFRPDLLVYKCYELARVKVFNTYLHRK